MSKTPTSEKERSQKAIMSVSVCICTYNRADYLRELLEMLLDQNIGGGDEVLVINNNSSDHTSEVVQAYVERLPLREIIEPEQGLSRARNRALTESKPNAIIFFDDDVLVGKNVVAEYREAFLRNPEHDFFGGKITVDWPGGNAPNWWSNHEFSLLDGLLIYYDLGPTTVTYDARSRLPYGASFAMTRNMVDQVGEFDVSLGVSGNSIGRGEESDYFERALALGLIGSYMPQAEIAHRFEPHRLKLSYLLRYGWAKANANAQLSFRVGLYNSGVQGLKGVYQYLRGRRGYAMQCAIMVGIYAGAVLKKKPKPSL